MRLPHAVGLVTDLDQHLAERARASLLAELRRREALLERHAVRSLRELRSTRPDAAPPALLIVVDEFATLVREVPSFVETVVDVAQRGRSLGLHLVLATQRPRGAVGDAIRANTNLRVAMRVADRAESEDVIEAPDAAAIPADVPGRAIALTGRHADGAPALTPFQAAYAGGRTAARPLAHVRVTGLRADRAHSAGERVLSQVDGSLATDLQLLVEAANAAAEQLEVESPDAPWLPALPSTITPDDLEVPVAGGVPFGVVDEPALQRRSMLLADLERDGSLLVYGASGSGKTVLLQSLARALAASGPPSAVQIYGLDFASGALGAIQSLPHCGAVVRGDDGERVLRLLASLRRALAQRKAAAGEVRGPRVVPPRRRLRRLRVGLRARGLRRAGGAPCPLGGGGPPARPARRRHRRPSRRCPRRAGRRGAGPARAAPGGLRGARLARRPACGGRRRRAAAGPRVHPAWDGVPGRAAGRPRGLRPGAAGAPPPARSRRGRAAHARRARRPARSRRAAARGPRASTTSSSPR